MAFTSGNSGSQTGGTGSNHAIEVVVNGNVRHLRLYDKPGEDQQQHKGDLWKFNFTSFDFPEACIKFGDVQKVYIIENDNDGWRINAIVTLVKDLKEGVQVLTQNVDINGVVNGDTGQMYSRYELTFA